MLKSELDEKFPSVSFEESELLWVSRAGVPSVNLLLSCAKTKVALHAITFEP